MMEGRILTTDIIENFRKYLELQEKSTATIEKYIRDVKVFSVYTQDKIITTVPYDQTQYPICTT